MSYTCDFEWFLSCLGKRTPLKTVTLETMRRPVKHGLLSVGLKLNCPYGIARVDTLINELGRGKGPARSNNIYRNEKSQFCIVFPPVGSADAAKLLIEAVEEYIQCPIFGNPAFPLQVCSPGKLNRENAALLAIGFYLGSDTLRKYSLDEFATTVSNDADYKRGKRIVIYDAFAQAAGSSEFDKHFAWWSYRHNKLTIDRELPIVNVRTDVLLGPASGRDIENVNLIASVLVHHQFSSIDGYWQHVGRWFAKSFKRLLERHQLLKILDAPWACLEDDPRSGDRDFADALAQLTDAAWLDAQKLRVEQRASYWNTLIGRIEPDQGLLADANKLIDELRTTVRTTAQKNGGYA